MLSLFRLILEVLHANPRMHGNISCALLLSGVHAVLGELSTSRPIMKEASTHYPGEPGDDSGSITLDPSHVAAGSRPIRAYSKRRRPPDLSNESRRAADCPLKAL